ncbi:kinase-like protein [Hypoxylon sp. EC38]|nr:kinase-like protein [Hypoxylon sp. EC38]
MFVLGTPPTARRISRRHIKPLNLLALKESEKIRKYFEYYKDNYKFDVPIAHGKHGVVVAVTQFQRYAPPSSEISFAIKRAYDGSGNAVQILENEIEWLRRLRGAPHVVQMLDLDPNPFDGLGRPTLAIEYVENGTLTDFIRRCARRGGQIPNRVLWAFFACLTRVCVAMAWPDRGVLGAPVALEQLPPDANERPKLQLTHGDLRPDNILIGGFEPLEGEHLLVPILKVCDWGLSNEVPDPKNQNLGVARNIFDIARIMRMLISFDTTYNLPPTVVEIPDIPPIRKGGQWLTASPNLVRPNFPDLDPDLRDFVIQCTSVIPQVIPSLEDFITYLELNLGKTEPFYRITPYAALEQDARIRDYLLETIFYASDDDDYDGIS